MLAHLSKSLSTSLPTNVAIAGLALLVLGAGGTGATLSAGKGPVPTPSTQATTAQQGEPAEGTRPTDTHGYCVSRVARAETSGDVNHGSLVSAAAHACGKQDKAERKAAKATEKATEKATKATEKAKEKAAKAAAKAARGPDGDTDDNAKPRRDRRKA